MFIIRNRRVIEVPDNYNDLKTIKNRIKSGRKKANQRKKKLVGGTMRRHRFSSYREYMGSVEWNRRRALFFKSHKRQCNACFSIKRIVLHHVIYQTNIFGVDPDSHLLALCEGCHNEYHNKHSTAQNMVETTREFVLEKRGSIKNIDWI